jgi:hypothetical protein
LEPPLGWTAIFLSREGRSRVYRFNGTFDAAFNVEMKPGSGADSGMESLLVPGRGQHDERRPTSQWLLIIKVGRENGFCDNVKSEVQDRT